MSLIKETVKSEGDNLIIKKTHDFTPVLRQMEDLRRKGVKDMEGGTDNRFIGRIPLALISAWCKEAGVSWDDTQARADVVKRKILSGDFDKFRSDWKGTY